MFPFVFSYMMTGFLASFVIMFIYSQGFKKTIFADNFGSGSFPFRICKDPWKRLGSYLGFEVWFCSCSLFPVIMDKN